ncbi:MAG: alcohol dehydrogenase catalytic domain-containing protein [Chloroflexota bacterium]
MYAIWLEENKLQIRTDLSVPQINDGEALIRVRLAGICATDLEMIKGYYPFCGVLGHEFVGEVVEAKNATELIGKRVVGEINAACGHCRNCLSGFPTHCENRTVLGINNRNGVFAEYCTLPTENLHEVSDEVADEYAVFTEPLAAAVEILEQVHICPTQRVLIIGAGRLGLLIAQTLALSGCDLSVIARHQKQIDILNSFRIPVTSQEELDVLHHKIDVVIEASGTSEGFQLASNLVCPRGTIVIKSTFKGDTKINVSQLVVNEITMVGSRCGPFEPALRLLTKHQVDPVRLIDRRYPLTDGIAALEYASQPGILKVLLDIQ